MANCNCYNNGNKGDNDKTTVIRHVYGNEITIFIPLTRRRVETRNGVSTISDDSQLPRFNKAVVILIKDAISLEYEARVENYVVIMRDKGTIPIGSYSITVLCEDFDGRPMRFKKDTILQVVDSTSDGGYYNTDEFDILAYYPIVSGRSSAVVIGGDEVVITEGKNFGGDDTPNDDYADINAIYGNGSVQVTDDEVILTI